MRKRRDFRGKRDSAHDIVGSAKGAIERGRLILPDTGAMVSGDVSLWLASSGRHSNGFSLTRLITNTVRLILFDQGERERQERRTKPAENKTDLGQAVASR